MARAAGVFCLTARNAKLDRQPKRRQQASLSTSMCPLPKQAGQIHQRPMLKLKSARSGYSSLFLTRVRGYLTAGKIKGSYT